jgi:Gram-negative bacterial TonB protein C-terminal
VRTLLRWAARLYPESWRERYGAEFDALLEDVSPSFGDVCDVLGGALRARLTAPTNLALAPAGGSGASTTSRMPVVVSLTAHAVMLVFVLAAAVHYVTPAPPHVFGAPPPPPTPEPPPTVTDARVFPSALTLYSSLPLAPTKSEVLPLYVANGVGISFLTLPDIGALYRRGDAQWRVWPGQALESFIVRRVVPEYPRNVETQSAVSVFVEYLIREDGSVKVLRSAGPSQFTNAARFAIEQWRYRPLEFENRPCQVVSRIEVRFDGAFVQHETP